MAINVKIDKDTYFGIDTIVAGGKTIEMAETGITPSGTKTITANGTYDVSEFESAEVNVPTESGAPVYQEKTVTENGTVLPDSGYDALSKVIVNVSDSGGATEALFSKIEVYEYTPKEDITDPYVINHTLGVAPDYIIVDSDWTANRQNGCFYSEVLIKNPKEEGYTGCGLYNMMNTNLPDSTGIFATAPSADASTATIYSVQYGNSSTIWQAGRTYKIYLMVI